MEELNALIEAFLKAGFTPEQVKAELSEYLKKHQPKGLPVGGFGVYEYQGITIRTHQDSTGRVVLFNDFETNVMTEREKAFALEKYDQTIAYAEAYKHTSKPRKSRIPAESLKLAKAIYEVELARQKHGAYQRTSDLLQQKHNINVSADTLKTSWLK